MYNTGNPIGSTAPKDFSDNSEITDRYVNDVVNETTLDRFGRSRLTIHGLEQKAQLDIAAGVADATADAEQARDQAIDAKNAAQEAAMMSGFSKYADTLAQLEAGIGTDYVDGDVVMVFQDESRGDTSSIFKIESGVAEFKLTFDKTRQDLLSFTGTISADAEWSDVPAHSDPAFDVQAQALVNRDARIVKELTDPSGDEVLGGFDTIEKLRAYSGYATTAKVGVLATGLPFISFAEWRLDLSDTTSVDDGVVVIVDANGRRWKRVILESTFYPEWAGASGDGITDDSNAMQKILNIAAQYKGEVKGAPGREYVTRWVNVPSNVTVSDIRILQKIESQTWATNRGSRKRAFHMENAKNVTFNRVYINGRRMYQNILKDGLEMAENGGCFAFAISGGCENILIDDCLVEDMATDALHIDSWLDSGRVVSKNITVRRSTFRRSRRNNISLLAGIGVTLDDLQLDDSGKVLTGVGYISGAGPCYLPDGTTVWSSPSIDLEPENGEYLENITITNIRYSGNRVDFLIYASAAKTNIRINNIHCENWTIRGTATTDSIRLDQDSDTDTIPIHNIILRNMNIYGAGRIHLWGGDGIVLDRVKTYEEDGAPRAKAFGATWNKLFIIKHAKNVRVSNVDIADDGLVMNIYGSYAGQRQGIVFDNTCKVSNILPTGSFYDDARARAANYFPAPPLHKTGKDYELPVFREGTTAFFEPVFAANIQGGGVPFGGFMGWVPSYTAERTAAATTTGGVINVNATSPQDVGCKLAVILASGKIEYKTITAVNSSTQYAVSPNLGVALSGGEYIRILKYKPAWAVTRQAPIEKLSTTDAVSNKVNQLIDALKSANVLNNEGF